MKRPRLLDLFSGAGGCATGYHRAGFDVTGIDRVEQPRYPFAFIQGDALEYVARHGHLYDVIHASPPCQAYTAMNNRHGSQKPRLIADTFRLLEATARPWVLENVSGAKRELLGRHAVRLTGEMFNLRVHRPRWFASSVLLIGPSLPARQADAVAVYGKMDGRLLWRRGDGSELHAVKDLFVAQEAMGVDWMTWDELRESIPPAYAHFVGKQLLAYLEGQSP